MNTDGVPVKYAIRLRLKGRQGSAEDDGTVEKTVTLSEIAKARIELPQEAKKALE